MNDAARPGGDSVRELLREAAARLASTSDSARLDAELLLCHALDWPRTRLFSHGDERPAAAHRQRFATLLEARRRGVPVAYLTGRREFWSLSLEVTPATLVPRPETELLVERALARLPGDACGTVADLGTGCGAIALALARERPRLALVALDRSPDAVAVARRNAARLGIANVRFAVADWGRPLAAARLRMMVSNPPYVAAGDPHLARGDLRFEPRLATESAGDGLADLRRVVACARRCLADGGELLVEHGFDQADAVAALFRAAGFAALEQSVDLAGRARVTAGRLAVAARRPAPGEDDA